MSTYHVTSNATYATALANAVAGDLVVFDSDVALTDYHYFTNDGTSWGAGQITVDGQWHVVTPGDGTARILQSYFGHSGDYVEFKDLIVREAISFAWNNRPFLIVETVARHYKFTNCIYYHSADELQGFGFASFAGWAGADYAHQVEINHCTFYNATAALQDSAIYVEGNQPDVVVKNSIINHFTDGIKSDNSGTVTEHYNGFYNNTRNWGDGANPYGIDATDFTTNPELNENFEPRCIWRGCNAADDGKHIGAIETCWGGEYLEPEPGEAISNISDIRAAEFRVVVITESGRKIVVPGTLR